MPISVEEATYIDSTIAGFTSDMDPTLIGANYNYTVNFWLLAAIVVGIPIACFYAGYKLGQRYDIVPPWETEEDDSRPPVNS